jgi:drug/metabolite transporter (DMT)-like permease
MRVLLAFLLTVAAGAAQAHWSVVPHHHPHSTSMLPDLGGFIVGGIFAIALALVAYTRFGQR